MYHAMLLAKNKQKEISMDAWPTIQTMHNMAYKQSSLVNKYLHL